MSETTFTRRLNIYVDSGQAEAAYETLVAKSEKLTKAIDDFAAKGKEAPKKLTEALEQTNQALDRQKKKISGELTPSLKDLQGTYSRLQRELSGMSKQDAGFEKKTREVREAKAALDNYRLSLAGVKEGLSKMLSEAKGVAFGVLVGNTVQAAAGKLQEYISGMIGGAAKLSDELADIQKTTGLSADDVQRLNSEIGKLDTRTSKSDLRQLAVEAGKLGITGVEGIKKFVAEANQIKVALGEDLGEDAIIKINKVSNIFKEGALNIASGINEIGQSSAASERYQTDFLFRMAGVSQTAKLAAGDILGFSAALDINGQEVEKSSTALQTFFIDFVKDTEKFGKAAGMANGELSKLLGEKGTSAAFIEFLKNLKAANPDAEQMLKALEKMGIDGSRGASTFLTLANNIELVQQQQKIANDAIREGTSITGEFDKRNNNLAANLEKLQKKFASFIEKIDLSTFAQNMVDFFIEPTEDATVALEKEARQLDINLIALQDVNLTGEARARLIKETNEQYGQYLPQLITEKTTMEELKAIQVESNKQLMIKIAAMRYQKELNQILEEEMQSREAIAQLQINMAKSAQTGADLGLTPEQVAQQQGMIKGTEQVLKAQVDNTGKRIDQLKEKYKNVALDLNATFDEILGKLENKGGTGPAPSGVAKGAAEPTDEEKKKAEAFKKFIQKLREELYIDLLDKEAKEIAVIRMKYASMREQANGNREALNLINILEANELNRHFLQMGDKHKEFMAGKLLTTKEMQAKISDVLLSDREIQEQWVAQWKESISRVVEEFEGIRNIFQSAHDFVKSVFDAIAQEEQKELSRDIRLNNEKKKNLKNQLDTKRINQSQYNRAVEQLDAELDAKKKEQAIKAFNREKGLKMAMAAINTASSVLNMLATAPWPINLVMAAFAAATGIAQMVIIGKSTPPEYGDGDESWRSGIGGEKHSGPNRGNPVIDPATGRTIARLEEGEAIIPADSTRANQPAINWMLRNRGRSLNTARIQENVFAAGASVWNKPNSIGITDISVIERMNGRGAKGAPNSIGITDISVIELANEVRGLRADIRAQAEKKVVFVKDTYDKFNDYNDVTFTKQL